MSGDGSPYTTAFGWECIHKVGDTSVVHVRPLGDHIEHLVVAGMDCPCEPRVEARMRADGSNGWLYVHHSLDGRERDE